MKTYETKLRHRVGPYSDFNRNHGNMFAGTSRSAGNSPALTPAVYLPPSTGSIRYNKFDPGVLVDFIRRIHAKEGIVIGLAGILTHHAVLTALSQGDSLVGINKICPKLPLLARYNSILNSVPRPLLPGNLAHTVRRQYGEDYGRWEGIRMVGDYRGLSAQPRNENMSFSESHPLMHVTQFVGAYPPSSRDRTASYSVGSELYESKANPSANAVHSFETVNLHNSAPWAQAAYEYIAHVLAYSESLFDYGIGVVPRVQWTRGIPKIRKTPDCPTCGGSRKGVAWYQLGGAYTPMQAHLVCRDCREIFPDPLFDKTAAFLR